MNVCRTVTMPSLRSDHVPNGAVHRDHVSKGAHSAKIIAAAGIRRKASAQIHLRGIVFLQVIIPGLVRLPDLDERIGNSFSRGIDDLTVNADPGSTAFCSDGLAGFHRRRILTIERAEKTGLCTTLRRALVMQSIH